MGNSPKSLDSYTPDPHSDLTRRATILFAFGLTRCFAADPPAYSILAAYLSLRNRVVAVRYRPRVSASCCIGSEVNAHRARWTCRSLDGCPCPLDQHSDEAPSLAETVGAGRPYMSVWAAPVVRPGLEQCRRLVSAGAGLRRLAQSTYCCAAEVEGTPEAPAPRAPAAYSWTDKAGRTAVIRLTC
jgi:hypothetical protein